MRAAVFAIFILLTWQIGAADALVITRSTVTVPESRSGKSTSSIELAVVRAGRSATPTKSAHIILAGGPGDSGVQLVVNLAERGGLPLFEMFDADVIGIDQRGTGASLPSLRVQRPYGLPLDRPGSPKLWLPLMEAASREVAADFERRGIHLPSYNTNESADDIEAVRRALGYERITLWGRSYGSHLALATLRRHPKSIERVVLANPEGPDDTLKLPSAVDAVLERRTDIAVVREVLARLQREPVFVEVAHPMTGATLRVGIGEFDVQWLTAQALGDSRTAATVRAAFEEMANGDFRRIARIVVMQRARMGVESAMKQMMDLSSGGTAARRARVEREAAVSPLGNAINFPLMSLRDAWGRPDLGDEFRRPVRSSVPVLILAGELDPRTPVENGRELARHLPNGKLIVVAGAAHDFNIFAAPEIKALLRDFLRGAKITATSVELSQ
ncbi:MAG TPA: alpha/beta fold hydrolase [Thermoanaerobaculia bacterium]